MNRLLIIPLTCLILAAMNGSALAIHKCGNSCVKCPRCHQGCCNLDVSEGKVKKHYWTIETEQVCIPKVVLPWQNRSLKRLGSCGCDKKGCGGCADGSCTSAYSSGGCGKAGCAGGCGSGKCKRPNHNGGRVITVRKMKKHSYECPVCEYKWSADGGRRGCSGDASKKDEEKSEEKSSKKKDGENKSPEPPVEDEPTTKAGGETQTPKQATPSEPALDVEPVIEEAPRLESVGPTPASEARNSRQRRAPGVLAPPTPNFSVVDPFSQRSLIHNR